MPKAARGPMKSKGQVVKPGDPVVCMKDTHVNEVTLIPTVYSVTGNISQGSEDVFINDQAAVRSGKDGGQTKVCESPGSFTIAAGSQTVFVNSFPMARDGDKTVHCKLSSPGYIEHFGSPDTWVDEEDTGVLANTPSKIKLPSIGDLTDDPTPAETGHLSGEELEFLYQLLLEEQDSEQA